jgi:hypothetical protein
MTELTKLEVGKTYVFKNSIYEELYRTDNSTNEDYYSSYYKDGFTLDEIYNKDGWQDDCIVIENREIKYFKEKTMSIRPEDEVTITTTYGELARAYAVLGAVNGSSYPNKEGYSYWGQLKKLLDPNQVTHDSFFFFGGNKKKDILDYMNYQAEWVNLLFPQEPIETKQQKQIRELREQAEELLAKAKKLEGGSE